MAQTRPAPAPPEPVSGPDRPRRTAARPVAAAAALIAAAVGMAAGLLGPAADRALICGIEFVATLAAVAALLLARHGDAPDVVTPTPATQESRPVEQHPEPPARTSGTPTSAWPGASRRW